MLYVTVALEPPTQSHQNIFPIGTPVAAGRQLLQPQDVRPHFDDMFLAQNDQSVKMASWKSLQLVCSMFHTVEVASTEETEPMHLLTFFSSL